MMLPDEQKQYETFRRLTPERRLALAEQPYRTARELKAAGWRREHPDWNENQIARAAAQLFAHARTGSFDAVSPAADS